jgi:transposase
VNDELRERILRLHAETGWGASRIANEAGTSPRTVRRVVSADAAQRDRGASLRWKRANPEHCRRLNEAKRRRDNPHDCTRCGAWIAEAGLCGHCRAHDRRLERRRTIQRLWAEGATLKAIAGQLGSTAASVAVEMTYMRRDGWDVPLRHKPRAKA